MRSAQQVLSTARTVSYADKLADPRWQQFRKKYLESHGNHCQSCKRSGVVTQIHHLVYKRGLEPWEHPDEDLTILCQDCHERWHPVMDALKRTVGRMPVNDLKVLTGAFSVMLKLNSTMDVALALAQLASDPGTVSRLAQVWQKAS